MSVSTGTTLTTEYFYKTLNGLNNNELMREVRNKSGLEKSKKYIVSNLEDYEHIINTETTIKFSVLVDTTSSKVLKEFDDIFFSVTSNRKRVNAEELTRLVRSLLAINKLIDRSSSKIDRLKNSIVPENIYKYIIRQFNLAISDAMLKNGYEYTFGTGIGGLKVRGVERDHSSKKNINWGDSNKRKKEIIARGGTPLVVSYDENLNRIGDNGGEAWLIYFTSDIEYWWYWNKTTSRKIENLIYYSFVPCKKLKYDLLEHKKDIQYTMNYSIN